MTLRLESLRAPPAFQMPPPAPSLSLLRYRASTLSARLSAVSLSGTFSLSQSPGRSRRPRPLCPARPRQWRGRGIRGGPWRGWVGRRGIGPRAGRGGARRAQGCRAAGGEGAGLPCGGVAWWGGAGRRGAGPKAGRGPTKAARWWDGARPGAEPERKPQPGVGSGGSGGSRAGRAPWRQRRPPEQRGQQQRRRPDRAATPPGHGGRAVHTPGRRPAPAHRR